jgi:D-sedoheptulose 7-phosphate isomerase
MNNKYFQNYFDSISSGLNNTIFFIDQDTVDKDFALNKINRKLKSVKETKGRLFFLGNGASAAFANHMALDFSKNGRILSKSLSDSALLTALANDYKYEDSFVEFMKIEEITEKDLVITISSSGNSPNVVNTLKYCTENKIETLALSGLKENNKSISIAKYSIYVPMKTYGMVECIHQIFLHLILDELMEIFEWDREEYQDMNASNFKL